MIWWVIISGFAWLVGNVIWDKFGLNDPKIYYVPLATFIFLMLVYIQKEVEKRNVKKATTLKDSVLNIILSAFVVLASGNLVKQLFWTPKIKQINDYWFGSIVVAITFILIIRQWATQKHKIKSSGR